LQSIFGQSQLVRIEKSEDFNEGQLVKLSPLGESIFGEGSVLMIIRGPYTATSFTYDITPLEYKAYDVYFNGNRYHDFAQDYLMAIDEEENSEQDNKDQECGDRE